MPPSVFRTWCAIAVLCIAAFVMVTSEFAPIGLLSQMAADLGRDPATVGLSVTLYAWLGAACGLLSNSVNRRLPRRTLLLLLMLILALSNVFAALACGFSSLLAARALGAVAHGLFWAIVAATAAQLAPTRRVGLATSIVLGGITLATVLGVPLANLIGQYHGWRTAFSVLAVLCLLSALALGWIMPDLPRTPATQGTGIAALFRRKDLLLTYAITGLTAAAHFAAYTFVEPFIGQVPQITPHLIAALLFAFGAAGFIGNLLSALLLDRFLKPVMVCALLAMTGALMLLAHSGPALGIPPLVALLMLWGVAISALFTGLQTWVLRIAGAQMVAATAMHTAVLNGAIGIGVIAGGWSLETQGLQGAMLTAGLVLLPALVLMLANILWRPSSGSEPVRDRPAG